MKNLFNKIWNKEEGFTLIELIIVIAILAIIAAIAIPNVLSAVDNSRKSTDITNAKNIANAAATLRAQNDTYAGDVGIVNVTAAAESGVTAGFADALVEQLNGVNIAPKFKGSSIEEDSMVVTIAADGTIEVYVVAGENTVTTASGIRLYPEADAKYDAN